MHLSSFRGQTLTESPDIRLIQRAVICLVILHTGLVGAWLGKGNICFRTPACRCSTHLAQAVTELVELGVLRLCSLDPQKNYGISLWATAGVGTLTESTMRPPNNGRLVISCLTHLFLRPLLPSGRGPWAAATLAQVLNKHWMDPVMVYGTPNCQRTPRCIQQ